MFYQDPYGTLTVLTGFPILQWNDNFAEYYIFGYDTMRYNLKHGIVALNAFIIMTLSVNFLCVQAEETSGTSIDILSEQWLSAVTKNKDMEAIAVAAKLVPNPSDLSILKKYILLAKQEGINASFFTAPFNYWDFQLWRDALFFQQLLLDITKGDPNDIQAIFAEVRKRISSKEPGFSVPPWPYRIWENGFGVCDRQSWVFCEIAYQGDWETQIVYLRDPKTKVSPHTICEIRKSPDKVWFADPHKNLLFSQKSVQDIADDKALLQSFWGNHPKLITALQDSFFWTPSYPQDYRPHNQKLYNILSRTLKSRCPRFGFPPSKRLDLYRKLGQKTVLDKSRFPMELWFYPFRLLRQDIIQHCIKFGIGFIK
jgi:hypothetical protein